MQRLSVVIRTLKATNFALSQASERCDGAHTSCGLIEKLQHVLDFVNRVGVELSVGALALRLRFTSGVRTENESEPDGVAEECAESCLDSQDAGVGERRAGVEDFLCAASVEISEPDESDSVADVVLEQVVVKLVRRGFLLRLDVRQEILLRPAFVVLTVGALLCLWLRVMAIYRGWHLPVAQSQNRRD